MKNIFTSVDIGSDTVKIVTCELFNNRLNLLAASSVKSKGIKTYILSNAPLDIPIYLKEANLEKYFDGKIISAEELIVKPNHKIYELILERYSLNASESIFIDDRKENIEAAIECGLDGIIYDYKKHEEFLNIIKNKLF